MSHAALIIFIVYCIACFGVGYRIVQRWFKGFPKLLTIMGAFLIGIEVSVPATYAVSCLFSKMPDPILWGTTITGVGALIITLLPRLRNKAGKVSAHDWSSILLVFFALLVSTWIMTKSFHAGADGQVYIGSNNIFDFGHSLGIIRSFSWGANIPFNSPFFAGLPFFYHYFFSFWAALWEYFGVPTVWAINIPSILSFSAMLIVIYYLPQIIAKQKSIVGWITVLLAITNGSLTFWQLLLQKGLSFQLVRYIWRLPAYPFAGPFDGSTISIFVTLNNYVNQRHLAFATALGLFIILAVARDIQKKTWSTNRSVVLGIMTGFLLLWNMVTYVLVIAVNGILLMVVKRWKTLFAYVGVSGAVGLMFLLPIAGFLYKALFFLQLLMSARGGQPLPTWNIGEYLWQNLGLLPLIAAFGFMKIEKRIRWVTVPFVLLFVVICVWASVGHRGFEQKSISFFIIGINALAAIGLVWLWQRKQYMVKGFALMLFLILTISGFVDLMPIKNEFAYPFIDKETIPIITWIRTATPKNSIFVSYSDMIDPVVLAGRKNYFGFYGNVGWFDRSPVVSQVYRGDSAAAKANNISYILIPKWKKNDFQYVVDNAALRNTYPVAYEDDRVVIFGTGWSL